MIIEDKEIISENLTWTLRYPKRRRWHRVI